MYECANPSPPPSRLERRSYSHAVPLAALPNEQPHEPVGAIHESPEARLVARAHQGHMRLFLRNGTRGRHQRRKLRRAGFLPWLLVVWAVAAVRQARRRSGGAICICGTAGRAICG